MANKFKLIVTMKNLHLSFGLGVIAGIAGWIFGTSKIPPYIVKFGSGIGWFLLAIITLSIFLLVYAKHKKKPIKYLTEYISKCAVQKTAKTIWFMTGLFFVALICWLFTGTQYARGVAILCFLFASIFSFFLWVTISLLKD